MQALKPISSTVYFTNFIFYKRTKAIIHVQFRKFKGFISYCTLKQEKTVENF